jgi:hypothetical protein
MKRGGSSAGEPPPPGRYEPVPDPATMGTGTERAARGEADRGAELARAAPQERERIARELHAGDPPLWPGRGGSDRRERGREATGPQR